jgi:hypothetical protein
VPSSLDDSNRSYIPGKPHPNLFEYLAAVDQTGWCFLLDWVRTWNDKYNNADKVTVNQVLTAVKVLQDGLRILGQEMQPYVWYLDARWGTLEILKELHMRGFGATLSLSSKAKPQSLLAFLKADLQKHEWRTVYHTETGAQLICLRAKKKAYLYLLSNFWSGDAEVTTHQRRKPPATVYQVSAPVVQGSYNKSKCSVDLWNKQVLAYNHLARPENLDQLLTHNFIHFFALQAYKYFCLQTNSQMSHLDFRLELLRHFAPPAMPKQLPLQPNPAKIHWPITKKGENHRCQFPNCNSSRVSHFCEACGLWMCKAHMDSYHLSDLAMTQ